MALATGLVLAHRYRLGTPLGRGGAAQAYVADDLLSQREVAVKLLDAPHEVDSLRREFERLRGIAHPHLTQVHEFGVHELAGKRRAFYTAELVRGGDLRAFAARADERQLRRVLGDVLDGLHLLHRLGFRHGDLKPDNVLIDEQGRAVLIDLGCAAPLGQATATLSGTPGYIAPELTSGQSADERADLYAFGTMLAELCPARLQTEFASVIASLTATLPRDRPSSAREVLTLLHDGRDVEISTRGRAPRCIGRSAEIEAARRALLEAARGAAGPRCVWVEGAPGVGRSRVLREISYLLSAAELDLLEARAVGEQPLRDALERKYGTLAPGYEALLEQLQEMADAREPTVLVLDDAQQLAREARVELGMLLSSLPEGGRALVLVTSTEPPANMPETAVLRIKLSPLSADALSAWAGEALASTRVDALLRFTGGYPRYVERALAALVAGRLREADLADGALGGELDDESARSLALSLAGLSDGEQRTLGEVALLGKTSRVPTARLLGRDLLVEQGDGWALLREADRAPLLAQLSGKLVRALHARSARELAAREQPEARAAAIAHFVAASSPAEARTLLALSEATALRAPRIFALPLLSVVDALEPGQRVLVARLLRLAGEAPRALRVLARVRREADLPALSFEAAEVYLALGRPARAERMLARCLDQTHSAHAELLARVLVRRGDYARSRDVAEQALAGADGAQRARLLETLGLSLSYLGQLEEAAARVDVALTLHPADDARARARCLSLRGFVLLRSGAHAEAAAAYTQALALAEPHGLVDLVVNALSNLGNARQSLGQWGGALETYERALRLARALGRGASVRSLRANLANLALEIGSFERAGRELDALEASASGTAETAALASSTTNYRAELALLRGQPALAQSLLQAAVPVAAPARERVEAGVYETFALLALGDPQGAATRLAPLLEQTDTHALDLAARIAEVEAYVLAATGRARLGVERLELALARVRPGADQALMARLETALSELYRSLSADALAAEQASRARARWERIALDLPPTLRDAFWAHPRRARLPRGRQDAPAHGPGRATLSLSRVRELNRRIAALHQREEVLRFALDAAIELTGAERGFVLLHDAGERGFVVAAAQNMDGARVSRSEFKWSRSIAERVIRQGEPVLTVDAGSDPRFSRQASVHAMQLKSVLCAPIRAQNTVRGALYLDNRLARARFAQEDAELLLTFADQVGIALTHAELVQALELKASELLREKRKVEALARGQAVELERLTTELSAHKASQATRFSYEAIVGRSAPMRELLSVLDRVIESDLSVLIQGESGTGKELIARALHVHGRRANKPFVGINCAALPEALLESELFGHEKGAFTGANSAREGLFVTARGGILFLDELGEMPLAMQAKLLRVLSDGEVRPVGSTRLQKVDVRLVCATNRNLRERVAEGTFREDLYYRIGVVELTLPPLRDRHEDIVPIAEAILRRRAQETGESMPTLGSDAVRALLAHPWPGNVRELQNTLWRASVMASGGVIRSEDLALGSPRAPRRAVATSRSEFAQREAERLLSALAAERWNVSKVAKHLGIPRNTLYRKLARYGIHRDGD